MKKYEELGYYHAKGALSQEFCDRLKHSAERLEPKVFQPFTDEPWGWGQLFDVKPFDEVLKNEKIVNFCNDLFNTDSYVVNHMLMSNKCSFIGPEEMWHQEVSNIDTFAPGCNWKEHWSKFLQVFIALDDHTIENGCLKIIPKSHELGKLKHDDIIWNNSGHKYRIQRLEMQRAWEHGGIKHVEMKRGDVLFFNHLLAHSSTSNQGPYDRRALLIQIQNHGVAKNEEIFEKATEHRRNFLVNIYKKKIEDVNKINVYTDFNKSDPEFKKTEKGIVNSKPRIAINVSGVSRFLEESYRNIRDKLIKPFESYGWEVDVFVHTWQVVDLIDDKWGFNVSEKHRREDDWKDSRAWYQKNKSIRNSKMKSNIEGYVGSWLKNIVIENHSMAIFKINDKILTLPKKGPSHKINTISQLYSKHKVGLMQQDWENENQFKYDVVMKMRTEVYFEFPILQQVLQQAQQQIVTPHYYRNNAHKDTHLYGMNDTFALGPSLQMRRYNSSYTRLKEIINNDSKLFNSHKILHRDLKLAKEERHNDLYWDIIESKELWHRVGQVPYQRYSKDKSKHLKTLAGKK